MRWIALSLLVALTGCASFHQRDDAIYMGNPDDAQYDPIPESDWMKKCLEDQKKQAGVMCVEGVDIKADRFEPVEVVGEKGDQYRFIVYWGWHGGRYGWVKKSDIAFPEDLKPVKEWTYQSHWDLCDRYKSCYHFDIAHDGSFTASYVDGCVAGDVSTGKCPEYCRFTQNYHSPDCRMSGHVRSYGDAYQIVRTESVMIYLIPVEGKGLCWSDSWLVDHDCTQEH